MPLILGTNSIKDTGFDVSNSVRLDSASTDALTRTFSGAGNRRTLTMSMWMKRSKNIPSGSDRVFGWKNNGGNYGFQFDNDQLRIYFDGSGGTNSTILTNRVFRDPSAWVHLLFKVDTTQSTEADRMRLYINGTEETSFSERVYPAVNEEGGMNLGNICKIGRSAVATNSYYDGYLCEVAFIDGTAVAHTEFGEFDGDSPNIWKPKDISGLTFGTNGFYLQFKESGTSQNSSGIGADTSGNDNHFAVENLTSIDQSTDTCTNNFATMNPLDNYYANSTFSEGNLKYTQGSSRYAWNLSTIAVSSGKWYAEVKLTTSGSFALIGITDRSPVSTTTKILGSGAYDFSVYQYNGDIYNNAGDNPANDDENYASAYSSGDIIGIALDLDNNKLYFSKNGQWSNGSGSWDSTTFNSSTGVVTITAPASTNNGHYLFASGDYQGGVAPTFEWNFGGTQSFTISSGNADDNGYGNFEYDVPTGFYSLNTKNLAEFG